MKITNFLLLFLFASALRAEAAMVRVAAVENGRTLIVERNGARERVTLAGVAVTDEAGARALLEWSAVSKWIMLEEASGGALAYRSPDALFLNRELVLRGFARATLPQIEPHSHVAVTFLGTLNLPDPAPRAASAPRSRARSEPAAKSGSGSRRRSTTSRSARPRGRR
ncbi:MAG TPA: hypothetical protein VE010_16210 [Thermoanaerobaculia bacterium]|nr:hypothetical protein [Thermoanaerobaculia bacterium]